MPWYLLFIHLLDITIMQQPSNMNIGNFHYANIGSIHSNAFQQCHVGNGAMLNAATQHYSSAHDPVFPHQYASYNGPFGLNHSAGAPSNFQNAANSPKFSCVVSFTPEEQQTFLQRAKNLGSAHKASSELTQQIVQNVISHIASSKNKNAQR